MQPIFEKMYTVCKIPHSIAIRGSGLFRESLKFLCSKTLKLAFLGQTIGYAKIRAGETQVKKKMGNDHHSLMAKSQYKTVFVEKISETSRKRGMMGRKRKFCVICPGCTG
jgi:hypothetical protein